MLKFKPYSEIIDSLVGLSRREQYKILLATQEWQNFRESVLQKNNKECSICKRIHDQYLEEPISQEEWDKLYEEELEKIKKEPYIDFAGDGTYLIKKTVKIPHRTRILDGPVSLEIHHRLYFENKLPWQYSHEFVTPLCPQCHRKTHENEIIYTYSDESRKSKSKKKKCLNCAGTGYLPQYDYWFNGICFQCGGEGIID